MDHQGCESITSTIHRSSTRANSTESGGEAAFTGQSHAGVGDLGRELLRQAKTPFGQAEQHDAAVRCQAPAVKGCGEFLASNAWQRERQHRIVVHGGCGALRLVVMVGLDTQSVNAIKSLRDIRQRIPAMPAKRRARSSARYNSFQARMPTPERTSCNLV